jgi:hypothetical protein
MLPLRPLCGLDWNELLRWEIKLGRFCPLVDSTVSSISGRKARTELLLLINPGLTAVGEDDRSGAFDMLPNEKLASRILGQNAQCEISFTSGRSSLELHMPSIEGSIKSCTVAIKFNFLSQAVL